MEKYMGYLSAKQHFEIYINSLTRENVSKSHRVKQNAVLTLECVSDKYCFFYKLHPKTKCLRLENKFEQIRWCAR